MELLLAVIAVGGVIVENRRAALMPPQRGQWRVCKDCDAVVYRGDPGASVTLVICDRHERLHSRALGATA